MYIERFRELFEINDNIKIKNLCKSTGLDRSTIGKYLNGTLVIPTIHLNEICNFFNISLDYSLFLADKRNYKNSKKEINKKDFSNRIKALRKENNLTQVKFSKILDINRTTISDYETGKKLINIPNLYTICKKYNISADYLLGKIN